MDYRSSADWPGTILAAHLLNWMCSGPWLMGKERDPQGHVREMASGVPHGVIHPIPARRSGQPAMSLAVCLRHGAQRLSEVMQCRPGRARVTHRLVSGPGCGERQLQLDQLRLPAHGQVSPHRAVTRAPPPAASARPRRPRRARRRPPVSAQPGPISMASGSASSHADRCRRAAPSRTSGCMNGHSPSTSQRSAPAAASICRSTASTRDTGPAGADLRIICASSVPAVSS